MRQRVAHLCDCCRASPFGQRCDTDENDDSRRSDSDHRRRRRRICRASHVHLDRTGVSEVDETVDRRYRLRKRHDHELTRLSENYISAERAGASVLKRDRLTVPRNRGPSVLDVLGRDDGEEVVERGVVEPRHRLGRRPVFAEPDSDGDALPRCRVRFASSRLDTSDWRRVGSLLSSNLAVQAEDLPVTHLSGGLRLLHHSVGRHRSRRSISPLITAHSVSGWSNPQSSAPRR